MARIHVGADIFESGCDVIDVTSNNRPDPSWRYTDAHGHVHRWYANGQPAERYSPAAHYDVPSLVWVKDGEAWYDDDSEPHDVGHTECRLCGEHITPRSTADTCTQYIPGLRWYRINGEPVTPEEFRRRAPTR